MVKAETMFTPRHAQQAHKSNNNNKKKTKNKIKIKLHAQKPQVQVPANSALVCMGRQDEE